MHICAQKVHVPVNNVETWEKEYKQGHWEYLEQVPFERSRSAIIVGTFYQIFAREQSILDVGCGTGTLSDSLFPRQKKFYTGIDISAEAIRIGRERRPKVHLVHSSAEDFVTTNSTSKFGMIVFNEVIYYLDHMTIFNKYSQLLAPNGHIVISCWGSEKNTKMRDELDRDAEQTFNKVDEIVVHGTSRDKRTLNYKVAVFRLKE
jgi:2-polyprenyl-3-methyl-5-hydroxy-6-metoxy-1,4-benzoquinol methylase